MAKEFSVNENLWSAFIRREPLYSAHAFSHSQVQYRKSNIDKIFSPRLKSTQIYPTKDEPQKKAKNKTTTTKYTKNETKKYKHKPNKISSNSQWKFNPNVIHIANRNFHYTSLASIMDRFNCWKFYIVRVPAPHDSNWIRVFVSVFITSPKWNEWIWIYIKIDKKK